MVEGGKNRLESRSNKWYMFGKEAGHRLGDLSPAGESDVSFSLIFPAGHHRRIKSGRKGDTGWVIVAGRRV